MPRNLHTLLDQFIDQFAEAVFSRAQAKFGGRGAAGRGGGRIAGARICPVPGCGKPGAGPRNRWFCREHARSLPVSEQKRLLVARREETSELRRAQSGRRGPVGRKLDMRCRVTGCKNMSKGPRFGYICDKHRSELSEKEQQAAREKWKLTHKAA